MLMVFVDFSNLISRVVDLTRSCWAEDWVVLYAYGSFVRGGMDEWSDIDVCLIRKSANALSSTRSWMTQMYDTFDFQVDPVSLSIDNIGQNAPWEISVILLDLLESSRLLLGEDVRAFISVPTQHKLRLNMSYIALSCVRRLYSIPREDPLPEPLSIPDISPARQSPGGHIVWQVATTVIQLLRAIIFLEMGVICQRKICIHQYLQRQGEELLASYCADVLELRKKVPRFGPLEQVPPLLERLSLVIPGLTSRLFEGLTRHGLVDPSYEPGHPLRVV